MDYDAITRRFADFARPWCIYAIGSSIAFACFINSDNLGVLGVGMAVFGGLIGARATENIIQTKTAATTAQGSVTTTTVGKTQTVEVKAPAAVITEPNKP